ncbi:unnamed protein product [Effrenium voratum]|uniref:Uncharacterized protein n=1 Tax=Effrenium voratum TaxID=2562239 RepID=A0AA36NAZ3_9DINO|nr:unnamed protein product [Effrenium voratum]CAJ1459798.1 unnamed protein product [Effrenium voratum]
MTQVSISSESDEKRRARSSVSGGVSGEERKRQDWAKAQAAKAAQLQRQEIRVGEEWNEFLKQPTNRSHEVMMNFWEEVKMRLLKRFGSLHLAVGESTVSFQKFCDLLRLIHFPLNQSTCRHLFGQVCGGQREMPIDAFKALLMERTIQSMRFVMEGWNLKQARVRSHIRTFVRRLAEVDERQKEQAVDRFQRKLTAGFIRSFWQQLLRSSVREDFITHASLVRALAEHEANVFQDHEIHYMLRLFEHMTRLADFAEGVPMSYFLTGLTLVSVMPKSDKLELIFEAFDNDYDHCLLYKQIHEMCHCICVLKVMVEESARGASDEHFQAELSQQEGQRSYECIRWHLQRTCNVQGDIVSFPELSAAWEMQPGQALPGWVQIRWVAKAIPGFEAWASQALSTCGQTSLLEPPVKGVVARHAQGESYIFKDVLTTRFAKSLRDLGSRRLVELTRQFGDGKSKAAMPSVGQSGAMPGVSAMVLDCETQAGKALKVPEIPRVQSAPSLGNRLPRREDVALPPQRWGPEAGDRFRIYAVAKMGQRVRGRRDGQFLPYKCKLCFRMHKLCPGHDVLQ